MGQSTELRPPNLAATQRELEDEALAQARRIIMALMTPGAHFPSQRQLKCAARLFRELDRRKAGPRSLS